MVMLPMSQAGLSTRASRIPQSQPVSELQAKNNAGGFSFVITPEQQLDRFLILGSASGTYYVGKNKLTKQNLENIINLIKQGHGAYAVSRAVEFSLSGRAGNNDNCLAVLAIASTYGSSEVKILAGQNLSKVARTGTHILHFTDYVNSLRGWGRSLKRTVSSWYLSKTPDQVAFQAGVKYRQRDGWSHKDVVRLCHPKPKTEEMGSVFNYLVKGWNGSAVNLPTCIVARELLHANPTSASAIKYITEQNLPREAIPTELLNDVNVWKALFKDMPLGATLRNLNKMTSLGILAPLNEATLKVVSLLTNVDELKKARLHPIQLLFAYRTYASGRGDKGSLTWNPVQEIVVALEKAFYLSFNSVEPTNKRYVLAMDISGSMESSMIAGSNLSAKEASMAMAMVTVKTEPRVYTFAFDHDNTGRTPDRFGGYQRSYNERGIIPINIDASTKLADIGRIGGKWKGGGTDCSLPMKHCLEKGIEADVMIVYTDSETWASEPHPHIALQQYRQKMKLDTKLIVVGMTANKFTIADPTNPAMMDIVGFDVNCPSIISGFAKGDF